MQTILAAVSWHFQIVLFQFLIIDRWLKREALQHRLRKIWKLPEFSFVFQTLWFYINCIYIDIYIYMLFGVVLFKFLQWNFIANLLCPELTENCWNIKALKPPIVRKSSPSSFLLAPMAKLLYFHYLFSCCKVFNCFILQGLCLVYSSSNLILT